MVNSNYYLTSRNQLKPIKSTLESLVDKNEAFFVCYGYINIPDQCASDISKLSDHVYEILENWLEEFNWTLDSSPRGKDTWALYPIE